MAGTTINLTPSMFGEVEKTLVDGEGFSARTFRFDSGVCGLRLRNEPGELVLLPYQGQQVWSAAFRGRTLTMRSMFNQPYPTRDFLATFGGFLQHCGATAMGTPAPQDSHPLHGELPNAPYQQAALILGQDEGGTFIGLTGQYQYTVAFSTNYLAQPTVKLYAGSSLFQVSMTVTNLKNSPMPLMYLAHINFRPVDGGRLVYSAPCNPQTVRVRTSIPAHIHPQPGYQDFIEVLQRHPERHHVLTPDLLFDPEVVFMIDYQADEEGWAHAMQVHPDGSADLERHRPEQLAHGIRWICRTPDQDALGFEAGTAEVEGYAAEKAKGNVQELGPGQSFHCDLEMGLLTSNEAASLEGRLRRWMPPSP